MLVDAHCHLGDGAFDADRPAVLSRAGRVAVEHIVVIGETLAASARARALAAATPGLSATAGVHPHEARTWGPDSARELARQAAAPEVVAVGETGLDYHYDHSPRDSQRRAFEAQLALAAELGKPVIVHAREADLDTAALLRHWGPRLSAVVLHSFSSGPGLLEAGMEIGAYFSFSGMITFKSWTDEASLTGCPVHRLLVETDAPYLAPVPHRGRRNEPAFVRDVARRLAECRGESFDTIARHTTENARRVFGARIATPLPLGEDIA